MSALPASIPASAVRIPSGDRLTETRIVNGVGGPEDPEAAVDRLLAP